PPLPAMGSRSGAVLRSVAAEVAEDLSDLADRVVGVVSSREVPYGARGTVLTSDLRASVLANLGGILDVLSGLRPIGNSELSVPRSTGRRRAQQGGPLETVLRAYSLAGQSLVSALLARAQQRSAAELAAFLDVATVALDVVDRYAQAVVESYRQAEAESQRRDAQRQQAMFDALLDGRGDPAVVTEAALLLGLPAPGPYVVGARPLDLAADHTLNVARDACAVYGFTAAWRTRGDREIGIVALEAAPVARLLRILRTTVTGRVGISAVFNTLQQVPEASRLAETALLTIPPEAQDVAWIEERLLRPIIAPNPR